MGFVDYMKANPVVMIATILSIVGIFVAIYGFVKNKKLWKYAGGFMTAGAAATAIGAWAYGKYGPQPEPEATQGFGAGAFGAAGPGPAGFEVTTPE